MIKNNIMASSRLPSPPASQFAQTLLSLSSRICQSFSSRVVHTPGRGNTGTEYLFRVPMFQLVVRIMYQSSLCFSSFNDIHSGSTCLIRHMSHIRPFCLNLPVCPCNTTCAWTGKCYSDIHSSYCPRNRQNQNLNKPSENPNALQWIR